jgi:hypothetical protein
MRARAHRAADSLNLTQGCCRQLHNCTAAAAWLCPLQAAVRALYNFELGFYICGPLPSAVNEMPC